ncbi:MAG: Rpn family recombination-promoting nuclease/putative transposase [Treponema sp.]|nr:Rpn family recombination-promoting nuclease/putative transposase [Treponema sp.]
MQGKDELRHQKILEKIKNFRLFEDDLESTSLLLQIILEKSDIQAVKSISQKNVKNLQGRSIRLDVQAEDKNGILYDIEIQRADDGAGAKRARYYSALLDANVKEPGKNAVNLPETYVIFITENDVFGRNHPLYHIERLCTEDNVLFNDFAHIIYVNGASRDESPLGHLMHDFSCSNPDDMKYKVLADRARYFKQNEDGEKRMCKAMEDLIEEEKNDRSIEIAEEMLKDDSLSLKKIAQFSKLPLEKVEELAKKLQLQMA